MQTIFLPSTPYAEKTVAAVGFFDGVHSGHALLLKETVALSAAHGARPALFTFADPPNPKKPPLSTLKDRLALFEAYGISVVFIASFSSLRDLSPEEFVRDILVGTCHAEAAVCGFNFRFGKGAAGDAALLKRLLPHSTVLPPVKDGEHIISSSLIRSLINGGDVKTVQRLLGSPYTVRGEVVRGKSLGRRLGFPTANVRSSLLLPGAGVYETRVTVDGRDYPALTDVGIRPTVEAAGELRTESYLLGFEGDLYGKTVSIAFLRRLRDEMTFPDAEALRTQLSKDVSTIKRSIENE